MIDASILACWLLPDEGHPVADAARARFLGETAVAPALLWFEIRNVLLAAERRGRFGAGGPEEALALLRKLPIVIDRSPNERDIFGLARLHRLTVYDASYLELALRLGITIATLDKALVRAGRAEGASLLAP